MGVRRYIYCSQQLLLIVTLMVYICTSAPVKSWKHECSTCPPGFGVDVQCNETANTKCTKCSDGFYSNLTSATDTCLICSKCGEGLFELHPCNGTHDVFCELCSWSKAPYNTDQKTKCSTSLNAVASKEKDDYLNRIFTEYLDLGKSSTFLEEDLMLGDQPFESDITDLNKEDEIIVDGADNSNTNLNDTEKDTSVSEINNQKVLEEDIENLDQFLTKNDSLQEENPDDKIDINHHQIEENSNEMPSAEFEDPENISYILNVTNNEELTNLTNNNNKESTAIRESNVPLLSDNDEFIKENEDTPVPSTPDNSSAGIVYNSDLFPDQGLPPGASNVSAQTSDGIVNDGEPGSGAVAGNEYIDVRPDNDYNTDYDGSGSGDLTVVIHLVDDDIEEDVSDIPEQTTTAHFVPSTHPKTIPIVQEGTETVTPEPMAESPSTVASNSTDIGDDVAAYHVGETKQEKGIPVFAIIMAIITTGLIFFVLGFIFNRRRSGTVTYKPSHKYKKAPTKPPTENSNHHELKHINSNKPTPHITYTDEDEAEWGAPLKPIESLNNEPLEESIPMLPKHNKTDIPIGNHQSPVDIDPDAAEIDDTLEKHPLVAKYIPENVNTITNTGSTIVVDYDSRDSTLTGGPLGTKRYCLNHIQMHWGGVNSRGSEHTINGIGYTAEIQLVHWNSDACKGFADALGREEGIAILSVLVKVGENDHDGLKLLTDCLPSIQYKSESRHIPGGEFDAKRVLPDNTCDYWTYSGSLTSPPYHENVTWIVFKDAICISSDQIGKFRNLRTMERDEDHLHNAKDGFLLDNYRCTMPLHDRKITASFL